MCVYVLNFKGFYTSTRRTFDSVSREYLLGKDMLLCCSFFSRRNFPKNRFNMKKNETLKRFEEDDYDFLVRSLPVLHRSHDSGRI